MVISPLRSCRTRISLCANSGFTLVELVAVLMLLGILGAAVFSRLPDTNSYQLALARDNLVTSLRLSQRTALSQHASSIHWQVSRVTADTWQYGIYIADAERFSEQVTADMSLTYQGNASSGRYNETLAVGETLVLAFDALGNLTTLDDGTEYALTSSVSLSVATKQICVALSGYTYVGICP